MKFQVNSLVHYTLVCNSPYTSSQSTPLPQIKKTHYPKPKKRPVDHTQRNLISIFVKRCICSSKPPELNAEKRFSVARKYPQYLVLVLSPTRAIVGQHKRFTNLDRRLKNMTNGKTSFIKRYAGDRPLSGIENHLTI